MRSAFFQSRSMKEKIFDSWEVELISIDGKKHKGKLTVTEQRIIFDFINVPAHRVGDDHLDRVQIGEDEYIIINRSQITTLIIAKCFFERRITFRLKNENEYVFDCGMRNMDPISKAVSLKLL